MEAPAAPAPNWRYTRIVLFRFFFSYFVIYCFPFPVDAFDFTSPAAQPYYNLLDWLIPLIGKNWFNMHAVATYPQFDRVDDSYYGLTFLYFNLLLSSVITLIWSIADRKKMNYEKLFQWFKLYLRFFLAAYLFGYGFVKVFPSQFQPITASRLTMVVGDQSPMLLAWNFMGYSATFMIINGLAEVIAGLLIVFRRTTTIGAILSSGVFSFVVIMDFSFNVPVRLLASHLLLISVLLILLDGRRLVNLFFLNKAAEPVVFVPLMKRTGWNKIFNGALVFLAVCLFVSSAARGIRDWRSFGYNTPRVPLHGVYRAEYFIRNSDTVPPLETDSLRWKQLVIDGGSWNQSGIIVLGNDQKRNYDLKTDTIKKELNFRSPADSTEKYSFQYLCPDKDHIFLKGVWMKDSVEMMMKKYDLDNYKLRSEEFKWITY